jgi:hypothetical protein
MRLIGQHVGSLTALAALLAAGASARADHIVSGTSLHGLGSFDATISYTAVDSTHGTLTVTIKNTTSTGNGGYITGIAFNNPNNQITGVTLSSTNSNFSKIGGSSYNNTIHTAYGKFDIGASISSTFHGNNSDAASKGVGKNQTVTFTFHLTGTNMDKLTTKDFLSSESTGGQDFVVRFRGIRIGDGRHTDTVTADQAPEPGSLALAALGALGLVGWRWRWRRLSG